MHGQKSGRGSGNCICKDLLIGNLAICVDRSSAGKGRSGGRYGSFVVCRTGRGAKRTDLPLNVSEETFQLG